MPSVLGEKNAYIFCQVLLAGYIVLLVMFKHAIADASFWGLALSVFLTGWLIFKSKWEKNEYYYFFYMDGVLILQYILVIAFNKAWGLI